MTIEELIEKLDRIKQLQDSGIKPDKSKYGAPAELAFLLAEELQEVTYEEED